MPVIKCKNCGEEKYKRPSFIRSDNVFCCRDCYNEYKKKQRNKHIIKGDILTIFVKSIKYGTKCFVFDKEDFNIVMQYSWMIYQGGNSRNLYLTNTNKKDGRLILHRLIMNCPENMVVDHISRNSFDNRKCNLRCVTSSENSINANTSRRKKVASKNIYYYKNKKHYRVGFCRKGKLITIGFYKDLKDAEKARDEFLRKEQIVYMKDLRKVENGISKQ